MAAVFNSQTYRDWMGFTAEDSVLGVAPLFHITGLIGHMGSPCSRGARW
jgi:long-chain acyl-CoA synthetase